MISCRFPSTNPLRIPWKLQMGRFFLPLLARERVLLSLLSAKSSRNTAQKTCQWSLGWQKVVATILDGFWGGTNLSDKPSTTQSNCYLTFFLIVSHHISWWWQKLCPFHFWYPLRADPFLIWRVDTPQWGQGSNFYRQWIECWNCGTGTKGQQRPLQTYPVLRRER